MIDQERLKQLFDYDPTTGHFTNIRDHSRARKGTRAGSSTGHGYRRLTINGARYYEHHLAWLYMFGEWPAELDHHDGDRSNNAIVNLRQATRTNNCCNSERETGASGLKGAYLDKRVSKWYSKVQLGGQVEWLGQFDTAEDAHDAFMAAIDKSHGEFALHNRPTGG